MSTHFDLGLEVLRPVLRPPVVPRTEAQGDGLAEAAYVGQDALADRLQRRPAVAHFGTTSLRDVPADDVRGAVVDGPEEPAPALLLRPEPRRVRAPELVRPFGADPSAVAPVSAGMSPPHRRQHPCALISRSTRFLPARIPSAPSRTFTLRWPSPRNGLSDSTVRISSTNSSSLSSVFGPRFPSCRRSDSRGPPTCVRSAYTLDRATRHASHTIASG